MTPTQTAAAPAVPEPGHEEFVFPCSFAQTRLWFLEHLAPGTSAYNVPLCHRLVGPLHRMALENALAALVERHETLRTTLTHDDGEPAQKIAGESRFELMTVDFSCLPPERREKAGEDFVRRQARQPFSLERGPLFRAHLVRIASHEHLLLLNLHHAVTDGWSLGVVARDLEEAYEAILEGRAPRWPELPIQYADFAHWQRQRLQGEALEDLLEFWRKLLGPDPRPLDLPVDHRRPAQRTYRRGEHAFELAADLVDRLTDLGRRHRATLFMVLLAAFQIVIGRWTGRRDPLVGTPLANRDRPELEGLIGLFVNLVPLPGDLRGEPSLSGVLERVRGTLLAALEHQSLPFERLVQEVVPERELSRNPLVQVTFSLEEGLEEPLHLRGLQAMPMDVTTDAVKFDLSLSLRHLENRVAGTLAYDADLFDDTTMARLCRWLRTVLETMVTAPQTSLRELSMLEQAERFQLLVEWNDTRTVEEPTHVLRLFRDWAAATPDAVALEGGDAHLTYGELARRARRVAHRLRQEGVGPEVPVAVWVRRSPEMVVAILGVLEAAGAYLPLDPEAPLQRVGYMVEDAAAACLVVHGVEPGGASIGGAPWRKLDELMRGNGEEPEPVRVSARDGLAYMIYTSGSTGRPKGVELHHGGLANLAAWHRRFYDVGPEDRATQVANPAFDAAVWEIWPYLTAGAALCFPPDELRATPSRLASWLVRRRVSLAFLPTPLGEAVLELETGLETLRRAGALRALLVGGDKLHWPRRDPSPLRLVNHYGPSEATVVSTWTPVEASSGGGPPAPPIGRPLDNLYVYVVDASLHPMPAGSVGELCVGGVAVGRGYRGRPALTAATFVPDPFSETAGDRMYRTGDLARWLPNGHLEFHGRRDHQVKVRGFRIEPGEIEAALLCHDAVKETAVAVRDAEGGSYLAAFVVFREGHRPPGVPELKTFLRENLPEYMVPGYIVHLERLPLTPNGKVDRRALPWDAVEMPTRSQAPETPAEEIVAGTWTDFLDVEPIGRDDDFFALGGHSLMVNRVLSRLADVFGVDLPLRAFFEEPTVAGLARRLDQARESEEPLLRLPPLESVASGAEGPVSFAQERMWFIHRMERRGAAYNLPVALSLRGELNVNALTASLDELLRRHEVLRTRFPHSGGRVVQKVEPPAARRSRFIDLCRLPEPTRRRARRRLLSQEAHRPFSLEQDLALRIFLVRMKTDEHVLLLSFHHIVADGASLEIFLEELASLYVEFRNGFASPLTEPSFQYRDFAVWQRKWLQGETLDRELGYWRRQLAGAPPSLDLPLDRPRPSTQTFRGASFRTRVPEEPVEALRALARRSGATWFMTLLAVFDVLLFRYAGQEDLVVGSPVANRSRPELEGMIGFFANMLALRVRVMGTESFHELVDKVRQTALSSYAHQDLPFEKLVELLEPKRDPSRNPVFQVAFSVHTEAGSPLRLPDVEAHRLEIPTAASKFDLLLAVSDREDGLSLDLAYSSDLFHRTTIQRFARHFQVLVAQAAASPHRRVEDLALLTAPEIHQILSEWGEGERMVREPSYVRDVVRRWASRARDRIALVAEDHHVTYGELVRRAAWLGGHLQRAGCGTGALVGVFAERSVEVVMSLLGILQAGGAYLPLDPASPRERIDHMIGDSRPSIVLASSQPGLPGSASGARSRRLVLDELLSSTPPAEAAKAGGTPEAETHPQDLAYVIYTSGSSGSPKGTELSHRGLACLMEAQDRTFDLQENDRFLQFASIGFDASIFEIVMTWKAGATLVLAPSKARLGGRELAAWMDRHRITSATLPPGVASSLAREDLPALRRLILAGEACPPEVVRRWAHRLRCFNAYGPTEDTVWATVELCSRTDGLPNTPIGRPVAGERARVLDRRLQPVPVGVIGELCLGGSGLGRGYLNQPSLTAERFVPDGSALSSAGERLYRSGDLARFLPDGRLEFLGRIDQQVKIRGFRVEPGEVEAALSRHPQLGESAVVARPDPRGDLRLLAFFTAGDPAPTTDKLRNFLRTRLPEPMVPGTFVRLDELPRNQSGKIDRRALEEELTQQRPRLQVDFRAPRTETERLLVEVWREVLGVDQVGIDDNFFDLGGHSLLLIRLEQKLSERLGRQIDVVDLFSAPTVASFARSLAPKTVAAPPREADAASENDETEGNEAKDRAAGKKRLARQLALRRRSAGHGRVSTETTPRNAEERR